jgi:hypothetical protein
VPGASAGPVHNIGEVYQNFKNNRQKSKFHPERVSDLVRIRISKNRTNRKGAGNPAPS